ncbi:uncharacterized protein VTP21DRAFT_10955 [Calcarisporiella thermophila]|uniref:uncharacterized protein n=1 Tax=Calcarisporiella thermophila TaxID=911321 RepID=UPI0037428BCE
MLPKEIPRLILKVIRHQATESEALDAIDAFVEEHKDVDLPEQRDRLSHELVTQFHELFPNDLSSLFQLNSAGSNASLQNSLLFFLLALKHLLPYLRPIRLLDDWLDLALSSSLYSPTFPKTLRQMCHNLLLDVLTFDYNEEEKENAKRFRVELIELYLKQRLRLQVKPSAHAELSPQPPPENSQRDDGENGDNSERSQYEERQDLNFEAITSTEPEVWSQDLEALLHAYGSAKPKEFFTLLNTYFLQSRFRLLVINLLSQFIRTQRLHLHDILETPLFESLLKSLQLDNSTTLTAINLSSLVMLTPQICTSLPPYLPQLFFIFARVLCWDYHQGVRDAEEADYSDPTLFATGTTSDIREISPETSSARKKPPIPGWDRVDSISNLTVPFSNPRAAPFFTVLYGLYPCNFLAFLRAPHEYLEKAGFVPTEDIDIKGLHSRSLALLDRHIMHPSLILQDPISELTDDSRWRGMEPADIVAQCVGFDLTNVASRVAFHQQANLDKREKKVDDFAAPNISSEKPTGNEQLLEGSKEKKESSIKEEPQNIPVKFEKEVSKDIDMPESQKAKLEPVKKQQIMQILDLYQSLKSGTELLVDKDPWESHIEPNATNKYNTQGDPLFNLDPSTDPRTTIASLQREILLLRNELNFELFLKQQHLQHIGRLHREHLSDMRGEAQIENLMSVCKHLRRKLESVEYQYAKYRESQTSLLNRRRQYQDELHNKLRNLRGTCQTIKHEKEILKEELAKANAALAAQAKELDDERARAFTLESKLKLWEPKIERVSECEYRIEQLTKELALWQEDTKQMEQQAKMLEAMVERCRSLEILVSSLEDESKRSQQKASQLALEVDDLKARLESRQDPTEPPSSTGGLRQMLRTESERRQREVQTLQTSLNELRSRNEELEALVIELRSEIESIELRPPPIPATFEDPIASSASSTSGTQINATSVSSDKSSQPKSPTSVKPEGSEKEKEKEKGKGKEKEKDKGKGKGKSKEKKKERPPIERYVSMSLYH